MIPELDLQASTTRRIAARADSQAAPTNGAATASCTIRTRRSPQPLPTKNEASSRNHTHATEEATEEECYKLQTIPSLATRTIRRGYAEVQTKLRPLLGESFELDGRRYPYFLHRAGTWRAERAVELALGKAWLEEVGRGRVLEVGDVLTKYVPHEHTVVDKYGVAPGVINEDVTTFTAPPFDLIISISTIEHVGWDELPRDPEKIPRVIAHLRELLNPGGTLWVTLPYDYNRDLDDLLEADALPFDHISYLKRLNVLNHWRQCDRSELAGCRYGRPFVAASGLVVARLTR